MNADLRVRDARVGGELAQFGGAEGGAHRTHAVMHGHRGPTEKIFRGGKEQVRENVALEVGDQQSAPGNTVEAKQQLADLLVSKVM